MKTIENKARVIAICNQKGGVGKTTTAISLAASLSSADKKVLLVDCDDSNPTLTKALVAEDTSELPATLVNLMLFTIMEMEAEMDSILPKAIYHHEEGYDVLPSTIKLAGVTNTLNALASTYSVEEKEKDQAEKDFDIKNHCLTTVLSHANTYGDYDYIIIDAAPALNTMSINVLAAANEVIIVTQAQDAAEKGIVELIQTVSNVKKGINPDISIGGLLITMLHNGAKSSKATAQDITNDYAALGIHIYPPIPRSTAAEQYVRSGKSILSYDPRSKVTAAYKQFANEFLLEKEGVMYG